jgi:hypothetical protein
MDRENRLNKDLQHTAVVWSIIHNELSIADAYRNYYINDKECMLLIEAKQRGMF